MCVLNLQVDQYVLPILINLQNEILEKSILPELSNLGKPFRTVFSPFSMLGMQCSLRIVNNSEPW